MKNNAPSRDVWRRTTALLAIIVGLIATTLLSTASANGDPDRAQKQSEATKKPTVVLVHGAFADSSSWNEVIRHLTREGYPVIAPANPLRGLHSDAAYLRSVLDSVKGSIVLAGHSYGGSVLSPDPPMSLVV
jgi:pimeloyl-ACP methyl ester carboxylesterase